MRGVQGGQGHVPEEGSQVDNGEKEFKLASNDCRWGYGRRFGLKTCAF